MRCWERALELDPRQRDRAHQSRRRCGRLCVVTDSPTPRFEALTREDRARARLRMRELQGEMSAPPHRGAHARARRAHVRRLRARARRGRRRVRSAARRAHDQRHQALPQLGDVTRHRDDVRAGALGVAGSGDPRVERGVLVGRGAVFARRALSPLRGDDAANAPRLSPRATCSAPTSTGESRGGASAVRSSKATSPTRPTSCASATSRARRRSRRDRDVRRLVRFERRDLLVDAAAGAGMHLIACRNVLIYFDRETQERLFQSSTTRWCRAAFSCWARSRRCSVPRDPAFAAVEPRERIFRRQ